MPNGYNTLVLWLAPQLGNYIRPTLVLVNAIIVNPLNNWIMVAIWGIAGFLGGIIAGTKKGAFVVGLLTWLSVIGVLAFCVYQLITTGLSLGTLPPIPPGSSIADVLGIPLIQSLITDILSLLGTSSSGMPDITSLIMAIAIYVFTPLIVIIVAGIIGSMVRPKESF